MISKIEEKSKTSFSFKLIAVIVLICAFLIAVMFCVVSLSVSDGYKEAARDGAMQGLETVSLAADNYFGQKMGITEAVASSEKVSSLLVSEDSRDSDDILRAVCSAAAGNDSYTASVWIIRDSDGKYISSAGEGVCSPSEMPWYNNMIIGTSKHCYVSSEGIGFDESCITIVYPVSYRQTVVGYAGMDIKFSVFSDYFGSFDFPMNGELIITDSSDEVIFAKENGASKLSDSEHFYCARAAEINTSLNIYMAVGFDDVKKQTGKVIFANAVLLASFISVLLAALIITVKRETRSLPAIKKALYEISAGNYNLRINDETQNEIGDIARTIDSLSENIQKKNAVIDDYESLDSLTGVKNRIRLYECIEDLIAAKSDSDSRFGVVFFDIDNFRWINETLGHKFGDEVLVDFAEKLKSCFGRVFRFSSDTFTVIIETENDRKEIIDAVKNFSSLLDNPVRVLTSDLYIKCSEGAALFPSDGTSSDALLCSAEIALARAKEKGKNRLSFFNYTLQNKVTDKAAISQLLTHALDKGELYLHYQPIVSTADNTLHGFEMLVRWESEDLGYVPPSKFVQIAEETGEIVRIGMWIFETGCRFLKQLNEYNKDIIMSINVSAVQLKSHDFLENIRRVLDITQVNPANVQVELTETVIVDFEGKAESYINEMHDLGFGIALDDFGTGYSSLNYLKNFPISCLKVDKSFVDNIAGHGKDYKITDSIIELVHKMGIKTVAEGVETMAQYRSIINLKCDYIQGFLMSKPMDEASALEFVQMYDEMYKPDRNKLISTANALAKEKKQQKAASEK